jgi:hypothetical protein
MGDLKSTIIVALEHCEAEGKIKIFSGIAMVSHRLMKNLLMQRGDGGKKKVENHQATDFSIETIFFLKKFLFDAKKTAHHHHNSSSSFTSD